MKKFVFLLLISVAGFSQPMSHYKYVIVASKFDAQKRPGQFNLNTLTKAFLEKNGYTVFFDNDILPADVSGESCNKIYANVFDDNSMRKTKLRVEIKDCRNAVLFVSGYGESTEKDNHIAYNQALRTAFKTFDKPEFYYDPTLAKAAPAKVLEAVVPATNSEISSAKPTVPKVILTGESESNVLSAQKIESGFQLVDTTPRIVLRMYATSQPDVFLAQNESVNGVVLKISGQWFFEYYKDKQRYAEPLNIKF